MIAKTAGPGAPAAACLCITAAVASRAFRLSARDIAAATRCSARAADARHIAMYLAHVSFGVDYSAIARAYGRDPSTVRYACARIENRRDAARFDVLLRRLEWACRSFIEAFRSAALTCRQTREA